jgi:protocatechuate 3,4-dioxygenase beta subunit
MKSGFNSTNATSMPVTVENMDVMNVNFTNNVTVIPPPETFNISGFKINDTNGNGVWDSGEMGIENWNINLLNATGTLIDRATTDAKGFYLFSDVPNGNYNVTEVTGEGFTPTNATFRVISVENMDVTNVNFTNTVSVSPANGSISGFKFNDINGNGTWEPAEPGLPNWTIVLTMPDGSNITATTNADGFYRFSNLSAGNYSIGEVLQPGWVRTFPSVPVRSITLSAGENVANIDFGNMLPQATFNISGFKISDTNGNGVWDPGETGIGNWKIMLLNDKGTQIASTSTDASGFYQFMNIFPGDYNVAEEMKAGFTSTNATSMPVTVENMDVMNVNFTNQVTVPLPQTFNISGFKVNDTNGNNVWEPGEAGIGGWNIMLLDDKGTQIASTSTDDTGFYEFTNLGPGTYKVTEEMKEGFTPSGATTRMVTIENKDVSDVNFLNHVTVPPAVKNTISGFKINDLNGNGKQDAGENGLPGWNIRLIGIVPGTAGINEEATTDDNGFYSFENLPAGMYLVVETLQGGYVPVGSPVLVINLEDGRNSMNNNFMNRPVSSLVPSLPGTSAKHG